MSSASSAVTYTSVYTDSEPGRVFWEADEEISDRGSPRVIVYGYDGLPMQPVAPPSPDYIPGPEDPQTPPVPQDEDEREPMFIQPQDPDYVPEPIYPEYIPLEDEQPLPHVDSPTAESPGYVVESDPEEDPEKYEDDETEDGPVDYPMDEGDDDDDDSSGDDANDEDEDEGDEEEEEEHPALADSAVVVPTVEPVSLLEGTKPVIPPPSTDISTTGARITVRLQASISLPPEAEVERLLAMTTLSPSPPISLSSPSAGERLVRIAFTQALIDAVTTALPSPPLLPLPQSLYIPPPVDRRDDLPESELPPRKRLCLSTLGCRYEAGESYTARPIRGRGTDYGFVSTVDAEARRQGISEVGYGIRDTWVDPAEAVPEVSPMTVGEVNTRVTELAELHEHDTHDLDALLEDAQDGDSMDGIGGGLCFPRGLGSLDRIELGDPSGALDPSHSIRDMRREMSDMQAELLAHREQQRRAKQPGPDARIPDHQDAYGDADRDGSHSSHGDNQTFVQTTRPCFYDDFMKCQPLNFKGTEGVVGLTRWIEKMESVFNISGCAIENQVQFATCTLLGAALTWWNGQIRTLGPDVYSMTWEVLKKKMTDKYYPQGEIKKLEIELWNLKVKGNDVPAYTERFQELTLICTKFVANETEKVDKYISGLPDNIYGNVKSARPKTLDETIELANDLMDQKLRTYAERQSDNKRKADDSSRNNHGHQQQPFKRQNVAKVYNMGTGEKKPYGGSLPKCTKCHFHHNGPCTQKCHKCNKVGHFARDCRSSGNTNGANTQKGNGANPKGNGCFECGAPGHFKRDCPKLKNKDGGNGNAQGWVYAVGNAEKRGNASGNPDSNVVTGTFLLNNRYASILFDTGADRSFISSAFSSLIDIAQTPLENSYDVELADGKIVGVDTIMRGCTLNFLNHPFNIDLMPVELGSFDVIIGMDWLRRCSRVHGERMSDLFGTLEVPTSADEKQALTDGGRRENLLETVRNMRCFAELRHVTQRLQDIDRVNGYEREQAQNSIGNQQEECEMRTSEDIKHVGYGTQLFKSVRTYKTYTVGDQWYKEYIDEEDMLTSSVYWDFSGDGLELGREKRRCSVYMEYSGGGDCGELSHMSYCLKRDGGQSGVVVHVLVGDESGDTERHISIMMGGRPGDTMPSERACEVIQSNISQRRHAVGTVLYLGYVRMHTWKVKGGREDLMEDKWYIIVGVMWEKTGLGEYINELLGDG
ncbi:putative reverse transcriptase domain-containing protein [Tanacetum coccineum]|uniref:Reverse transcriptase domain-containing protein n=1 Tax=Tanacetum coccineum TaxID=301880 RepID=A0ABQ5GRL3_9ASTR